MIVRRIPTGYYVKITPSNVEQTYDILYKGRNCYGISPRYFVERIKQIVKENGYTYVIREDGVYSYRATTCGLKPYKTLGELE